MQWLLVAYIWTACSLHFKRKNVLQTEASSQIQHTRSYLIGPILSTCSLVWNDQLTLANGAGKTKLAPHFITEEREILHFDLVVISPNVWEKHNMFFFSSWVNPLQPIHTEITLLRYSKYELGCLVFKLIYCNRR